MSNKTWKIAIGIVIVIAIIIFAPNYIQFGDNDSQSGNSNEQVSLTTSPNPARAGQVTFTIAVHDTQGNPVDNAQVAFDLNMTTMNMGKQSGTATSQGNGNYAAMGNLSMRGPWRVSTKVTMPDGNLLNKDFVVNAQ